VIRLTRSQSIFFYTISLLAILVVMSLNAQTSTLHPSHAPRDISDGQSTLWNADHASHMMGMPEVKPKSDGQLVLTKNELRFDSVKGGHGSVAVASITAVHSGDEQVEKGGVPVRVARMFLPYGGGSVVAAVYHGPIGLLTIEFRDSDGGYHGMVFRMPVKDAAAGLNKLYWLVQARTDVSPGITESSCDAGSSTHRTVLVKPIATEMELTEVQLPAEYKVLVYEQLIQKLETKAELDHVYRYGSREQNCATYSVSITIKNFKKGDNAVRASALYLGAFIGTTQLAYHLRVTDKSGQVIVEKDLKKTVRGERESLDVTDQIAKATAKSLVKVSKKS
jgi:hypothetical protein